MSTRGKLTKQYMAGDRLQSPNETENPGRHVLNLCVLHSAKLGFKINVNCCGICGCYMVGMDNSKPHEATRRLLMLNIGSVNAWRESSWLRSSTGDLVQNGMVRLIRNCIFIDETMGREVW